MSRMTAAQVIGLGDYLEPDFEPISLTVSQLLGVLGYHNIKYPTPYSKPKLVQLFNDEIKAKATKLKKQRIKKENSIASDEGIMDGMTGRPLRQEPLARRSSRRLSHAPLQEEDLPLAVRPEPPKRRRSSAQPTLGGTSSRSVAVHATLIEESEPEEDELPVKKVGRRKKTSEAAGAHGRRVSNPAAEDSGWDDNNIFQSGAESSSPARPSPARSKGIRKSVTSRRSRKSLSAPPQLLPSSPPRPLSAEFRLSPPQSTFDPQLPIIPPQNESGSTVLKLTRPTFIPMEHPSLDAVDLRRNENSDELNSFKEIAFDSIKEEASQQPNLRDKDVKVDDEAFTLETPEDQPTSAMFENVQKVITEHRRSTSRTLSPVLRLFYLVFAATACYTIVSFKLESAPIGYCDRGSNMNTALEQLKDRRFAVEACNKENRTFLYPPPLPTGSSGENQRTDLTPCPLPPLVPWTHPERCTPCPDHATCTQYSVTCDLGYLLHPHPLVFFLPASASPRNTTLSLSSSPTKLVWKVLSSALDGIPGLGSIALPPRCVEDPKRKRNIGALGKAIESLLGQERGRRLCAGDHMDAEAGKDLDGGDAKRWGIEVEDLRGVMKKKTPPHLLATFDDTFNEAIQQLIQWGGVILSEDQQDYRYVAHKMPDLTWDCVITVKSRELWAEWRGTAFGVILVVLTFLFGQARAAQKRTENKRVAELVQIALDTLRNQELAHYTDPITAPQPYLSSLQLRDLILQDEHSVSSRSRLWDQVERVVEGNANVRVNLQEISGGDEMRVWRWVGSAGRAPGVKKEVQLGQ